MQIATRRLGGTARRSGVRAGPCAAGLLAASFAWGQPGTARADEWYERTVLYGYADVVLGYNRYDSKKPGFDAYHFTLNMDSRLSDDWRFFGDVTFEHGAFHTDDPDEALGELKTRYFIEGTVQPWLRIRAGRFLTPFAEMNTYHDASPTYLSVTTPRSVYWSRVVGHKGNGDPVKGRLFAKESVGAWIVGEVPLSEWTLRWDAYTTNGTGTGQQFKVDDNDSFGVGGRWEVESPFGLKLGASAYREIDGRSRTVVLPVGAHLVLEVEGAKIQAEVVHARLRPLDPSQSSNSATGWYAQGSYAMGRVTPYYRYDWFHDQQAWNPDEKIHTAGVNLMLSPRVYLKAEYGYDTVKAEHEDRPGAPSPHLVQSQLAAAF